jgi:hypothetical protein
LDEFSFQLKGELTSRKNADAVRPEVRVLDRIRAGQTTDFDLGLLELGTVDLVELTIPGLSAMGLQNPSAGSLSKSKSERAAYRDAPYLRRRYCKGPARRFFYRGSLMSRSPCLPFLSSPCGVPFRLSIIVPCSAHRFLGLLALEASIALPTA